jgi:hypothetical protein
VTGPEQLHVTPEDGTPTCDSLARFPAAADAAFGDAIWRELRTLLPLR